MSEFAEYFDRADQKLGEALRELQALPFDAPRWVRAEAEIQAQAIRDQRERSRVMSQDLRRAGD